MRLKMATVAPVDSNTGVDDIEANNLSPKTKSFHENQPAIPNVVTTDAAPVKKPRIYYLDSLRTWLTLLVVIHHCFWVVVSPTGWTPFYRPWPMDIPTLVISYMVLSGDQAYFMGLFFFISGFVTVPSLARKGTWLFLKDRFIRLVVPVILYELVFFPLLFCFTEATWQGPRNGNTASMGEVWQYYFANYQFTNNPLWFLMTLFAFSSITAVALHFVRSWREFLFAKHSIENVTRKKMIILLMTIGLGFFITTYLLRIPFPNGYFWIPIWGNLAFLGQYIILFVLGMLANCFDFLNQLRKQDLIITLSCSFVLYFVFQTFQTYLFETLPVTIGFYFHMLLITLFEQYFAIFWIYSVLVLFREYQNAEPSRFFKKIIGAAYATYIVHQWVIIALTIGLAYPDIYPLLVVLILCVTTPFLSWGLALLLKAIPGSDLVL